MNITRPMLIEQLAEKHHYSKKSAAMLIDDFTDVILDNMRNGNSVTIRNFGCFDMLERKEHPGRHPMTGETVVIPKHWIPRFYPAEKMRKMVKLWEDDTKRGAV